MNTFNHFENEILVQLIELAEEEDGILSMRRYINSKRNPSLHVVLETFGTWNRAAQIIDYVPYIKYDVSLKQEDLLRLIKELHEKNNGTISLNHFKNVHGKASIDVIERLFGSWEGALVYAGILPSPTTSVSYTKEEMLNNARNLYLQVGQAALTKDMYMESRTEPSLSNLIYAFGTWEDILKEAALSKSPIKDAKKQEKEKQFLEEAIDSILLFKEENNSLSENLYKEQHRSPSATTIRRRLGSWNNLLTLAGLIKDDMKKEVRKQRIEQLKKEAIQSLQQFAKETGTTQERVYKEQNRKPSATTLRRYFGTWDNILALANLKRY